MGKFIIVDKKGKRIGKSELKETVGSRLGFSSTPFSTILKDTKTGKKFKSLELSGRITPLKKRK